MGMAQKLILIKHSQPDVQPEVPANQWHLSNEGGRRCVSLAEQIAVYQATVIVTSVEPKAVETGQFVTQRLGVPCETAPNLHEHDRRDVGFASREIFEAQVRQLFEVPARLVFGHETADNAYARFANGLVQVLERHSDETVAVVAHGTVIALWVSHRVGIDGFSLWQRLGLPSFVAVSMPEAALLALIEMVAN